MIELTWFGTATVLLNCNGEKLLFDPFFRMNKKLEQPSLKSFCEVDHIFNTHPHFDHLIDAPQILKNGRVKLYGTPTAYLRLETQGTNVDECVEILCPHEKLETKNATICTHRSRHVKNDIGIVLLTAMKILFTFQIHKAIKILGAHHKFHMNGDILAFEVQSQGKNILIFGSAGIDKDMQIPEKVDVLVWPYQGRLDMWKYSLPIIEKIKPKTIILDHFDNAFPPITGKVNVHKFVSKMHKIHPEIEVIVPKYAQKISLE